MESPYLGTWGFHPRTQEPVACIWQREGSNYKLIESTMSRVDNQIVWETHTGGNTRTLEYLNTYYSYFEANTIEEAKRKCVKGLLELQPESRAPATTQLRL